MDRPYIICHMTISLDGKVTGDFLFKEQYSEAIEEYYEINRKLKCDGFICGRVTMEGSFTQGWYPDLSDYEPVNRRTDYIPPELSGFYAVAFDTNGKLGWKSNLIVDPDEDPGYDGAQIIEVLSEKTDERYLGYLEAMKIPYIFAGESKIDIRMALFKLKKLFGINKLLLEGGSIINGSFELADAVDELSLVVAPVVADSNTKPLFNESNLKSFKLEDSYTKNDVVVLRYKRRD